MLLAGVQGLSGLSKSELKSKIVGNWSAITSAQSSPEEPTGVAAAATRDTKRTRVEVDLVVENLSLTT